MKTQNLVYLGLVVLALTLGIREYGVNVILHATVLLYCMFMPILIAIEIYLVKTGKRNWARPRVIYLVVSGVVIILFVIFVLPAKLQTFVMIFVPLLLVGLFIVHLLLSLVKR